MISREDLFTLMNEKNENQLDLLCKMYDIHKNLIEIMKLLGITEEDFTDKEYCEASLHKLYRERRINKSIFDLRYIKKMQCVKHVLAYSRPQENVLVESLDAHIDLSHLDPAKYDYSQMLQVKSSLKKGIDISHLDPQKYDAYQMSQIILGLENGIDLSHLDPYKYNSRQMDQIISGLKNDVDISGLNPRKYDYGQMWQIRLGLENGIDISHLDPDKYNWHQMSKIRIKLESNSK